MEERKTFNKLREIEKEVRGKAERIERVQPPKKDEKKSVFWRRNLKEVK